jgi:hypothetical protein
MKKKARVVMLPTEKTVTNILKTSEGLDYNPFLKTHKRDRYQHLYLISDEEIKEGDWKLINTLGTELSMCIQHKKGINYAYQAKVIASTDYLTHEVSTNKRATSYKAELPTFSEDFIKAYVKANGIDEVMVEYTSIGHLDLFN